MNVSKEMRSDSSDHQDYSTSLPAPREFEPHMMLFEQQNEERLRMAQKGQGRIESTMSNSAASCDLVFQLHSEQIPRHEDQPFPNIASTARNSNDFPDRCQPVELETTQMKPDSMAAMLSEEQETSPLLSDTDEFTSPVIENEPWAIEVRYWLVLIFGFRTILLFYGTWFFGFLRDRYYHSCMDRFTDGQFELTPYVYFCSSMFCLCVSAYIIGETRQMGDWGFQQVTRLPRSLMRTILRIAAKFVGILFRIVVLVVFYWALRFCVSLVFFHLEAADKDTRYLFSCGVPWWVLVACALLFVADTACSIIAILTTFIVTTAYFFAVLFCFLEAIVWFWRSPQDVNYDKSMEEGKMTSKKEKTESDCSQKPSRNEEGDAHEKRGLLEERIPRFFQWHR